MRSVLLATALMVGSTAAVAADPFCDDLRARLERGFSVRIQVHGVDLNDTTQTWDKEGAMTLIPSILNFECSDSHRFVATFDSPVTLSRGGHQLAGFVDKSFKYFNGLLAVDQLQIHNSLVAAKLHYWGFDTFEGVASGPYTAVFGVPNRPMPYQSTGSQVLGVAGRGSQLFQISERYTVDLPPL